MVVRRPVASLLGLLSARFAINLWGVGGGGDVGKVRWVCCCAVVVVVGGALARGTVCTALSFRVGVSIFTQAARMPAKRRGRKDSWTVDALDGRIGEAARWIDCTRKVPLRSLVVENSTTGDGRSVIIIVRLSAKTRQEAPLSGMASEPIRVAQDAVGRTNSTATVAVWIRGRRKQSEAESSTRCWPTMGSSTPKETEMFDAW